MIENPLREDSLKLTVSVSGCLPLQGMRMIVRYLSAIERVYNLSIYSAADEAN